MTTDDVLVARATAGDQQAFAELYERYFDRVHDFLTRLVRDRSEAADLAQDTFIKAIGGLSGLASGTSFKSWLFTIARNTALTRLERASRVRPLEGAATSGNADGGDGVRYDVVDASRFADPEEAYEAERLASLVWEAARAMDPKAYSVLDLNVRQGFSSAEIADVLGVSKNNAYVMVNRMKRTLEEAIGALALFRQRLRRCPELEAVLARFDTAEITPEIRRAIDRHTAGCATCGERRRALASPFAILGGLIPLRLTGPDRARVDDAVLVAYRDAYPPGGVGAPDGQVATNAGVGGVAPWVLASPDEAAATVAPGEATARLSRRRLAALLGALVLLLLPAGAIVAGFPGAPGAAAPAATPAGTGNPAAALGPPASSPTPAAAPPATEPGAIAPAPPGSATPVASLVVTPASEPPASAPAAVVLPATPRPARQPTPAPPAPTRTPRPIPTPTAKPTPTPAPTPTPTPTPCAPALSAWPGSLFFGTSSTRMGLVVTATGCPSGTAYTARSSDSWLSARPRLGTLQPGVPLTLDVRVDRTRLPAGPNLATLTIRSGTSFVVVDVEAIGTIIIVPP